MGLSACYATVNRCFPNCWDFGGADFAQNGAVYEKRIKNKPLFLLGKSEEPYRNICKCTKIHTGACGCMKRRNYL